jgi:hypothetical protein
MNILLWVFLWTYVCIFPRPIPKHEITRFYYVRSYQIFTQGLTILTSSVWAFLLLHSPDDISCCQSFISSILVGVCWCLIAVLFYIPWWIMVLSTFSFASCPSVYLTLWNFYSNILPILKMELFYFFCWVIVLYVLCIQVTLFCKGFLSDWSLSNFFFFLEGIVKEIIKFIKKGIDRGWWL